MSDLVVRLDPPYPVRLRDSFAEAWAALAGDHGDRPWFVVADRRVVAQHPRALRGLPRAARRQLVEVQGGERAKSPATFWRLHREALDRGLGRDTLVVALGGGTVGDLAGFFAATWMRGVDWAPLATTSLALADSSIGGKTAVNLEGAKNLVGAFHQPVGVYGAMEALQSLPARHRRAGIAEVLKCGIIRDPSLHERLRGEIERLEDPADPLWHFVLDRSCRVKAAVVEGDPREASDRALLNFGHTVGHALEATLRPAPLHGEAVGLGMIAATVISEEIGLAPTGSVAELEGLLRRAGLPVRCPRPSREAMRRALRVDKKGGGRRPRMVLCGPPGSATHGHPVALADLEKACGRLWRRPGERDE